MQSHTKHPAESKIESRTKAIINPKNSYAKRVSDLISGVSPRSLDNPVETLTALLKDFATCKLVDDSPEIFSINNLFKIYFVGRKTTLLNYYAEKGDHETIKFLLRNEADPNLIDDTGQDALAYACTKRHMTCIKILLQRADSISKRNALIISAKLRHHDVLKMLLKENIAKEYKSDDWQAPLTEACKNGDSTCVEILLKNGAKLQKHDDQDYPLSLSAKAGSIECVSLLLDSIDPALHKSYLDYAPKISGTFTPLQAAAWSDRADIVKLLLSKGADPLYKGISKSLPFNCTRDFDCIKLLLEAKGDVGVDHSAILFSAMTYANTVNHRDSAIKNIALFLKYDRYKKDMNTRECYLYFGQEYSKKYGIYGYWFHGLLSRAIWERLDEVTILLIDAKADVNAVSYDTYPDKVSISGQYDKPLNLWELAMHRSGLNVIEAMLKAGLTITDDLYSFVKKALLPPQRKMQILHKLIENTPKDSYKNSYTGIISDIVLKTDLRDPHVKNCLDLLDERKKSNPTLRTYKAVYELLVSAEGIGFLSTDFLHGVSIFPKVIAKIIGDYAACVSIQLLSECTVENIAVARVEASEKITLFKQKRKREEADETNHSTLKRSKVNSFPPRSAGEG